VLGATKILCCWIVYNIVWRASFQSNSLTETQLGEILVIGVSAAVAVLIQIVIEWLRDIRTLNAMMMRCVEHTRRAYWD